MTRPASESSTPLLPLGAMAAGFGLMMGGAHAQPVPAAAASAPVLSLPQIHIKGDADRESAKDNLKTRKTNIGRGTQEIRDVPQSLTVVTEKLINDVKLDSLRQALHYTAGITFAATENGTDQDIRLRGFPIATTGDLLIDGMKDPSQYDRDTFNYDRIEVMRGSASMIFGRGSTGGVVNQVMKKPLLEDRTDVMGTVGTGKFYRSTVDFNKRLGETSALRLNAMVTNAENYGARIDKQGIAPSLAFGLGTDDEITVGAFMLNVNNTPLAAIRYFGGSVASQINSKNFYGTNSDYQKGEANYIHGSWKHKFGEGKGELNAKVRSGIFMRDVWATVAGFCSVPLSSAGTCTGTPTPPAVTSLSSATPITRSGLTPRRDKIRGTYMQMDYNNTYDWLGLKHDVLAGVDLAFESAARSTAYGTVGTNYNKGGTSVGTPNDGRETAALPLYRESSGYKGTSYGAFAQDLVQLPYDLKFLAGVRYDHFDATTNQKTFNANGTVATNPSSEVFYPKLWSYRTGLLYQPTQYQSYHVSYGTSFNTSSDTYQYTTPAIAAVPAEKSRNIEVGAKLDWLKGDLSTRFALYRTEKYNERTTDADFAGSFPVLSGKRHTEGVEMDVVGRITKELEVYVSYSHVFNAKIDKVGTAIAANIVGSDVGLTPKNTGAVWLGYQVMPKLRIGAGVRGASTNNPLQGTTGAAQKTAKAPGYVAIDAMAEYTFTPDVYAQLNASNLANRTYGDQLYPGFYTAGETRNVKLTVGLRY